MVQPLTDDTIRGFDIALFSAGSGTREEWAPRFAEAGAIVVDNSSFWRMDDRRAARRAEVNPEALEGHRGIVANPNCSTMQMVVALKPMLDAVGIERIVVSTYQSVSGTGQRAVRGAARPGARHPRRQRSRRRRSVYPHQIAFNVLPQVETFKDGDDYTTEERKMMAETRKILGADDCGITATCVRVPVYIGHSESINVQTRERPVAGGVSRAAGRRARRRGDRRPGATASTRWPIDAAGHDDVFVGRIRRDPSHERSLNLWVVGDNLRKGAATNAVQVAELLYERNLLRSAPAA